MQDLQNLTLLSDCQLQYLSQNKTLAREIQAAAQAECVRRGLSPVVLAEPIDLLRKYNRIPFWAWAAIAVAPAMLSPIGVGLYVHLLFRLKSRRLQRRLQIMILISFGIWTGSVMLLAYVLGPEMSL
jgi:hypothetical protein